MTSDRLKKYVRVALDRACERIKAAPKGSKNITLNAEAFGIGQLAGGGALPRSEAASVLLAAAMSVCIDQTEAESTIKSGLDAGLLNPRELSESLLDAQATVTRITTASEANTDKKELHAKFARAIYRDAGPITGTIVERYLRDVRGLQGPFPSLLRCHPGIYDPKAGCQYPAMVAPVMRADARSQSVSAIHRTFLDPDTNRKILSPDAKRMLGACKGGAVWLGQYAAEMCIAEGIEKALACQHASDVAAVAGLSATLMPHVVWPRGTRKVIICADPNVAGELAINRAAIEWTTQNIEVYVTYPPEPNRDWDECEAEAVRDAIRSAKPWRGSKGAIKRNTPLERQKILQELVQPGEQPDFERDANGRIFGNEFNTLLALTTIGLTFKYNAFRMEYEVHGLEGYDTILNDASIDEIYLTLEREYTLKTQWNDLRRIIKSAGRRATYHPIKDYLARLQWDGVPRIDEWLSAYGGAPNEPFTRAVGRIMLIAAVRRMRHPGTKFDEMVVFEGVEGKNKSSALRALVGAEHFTDDAPINDRPREVIEKLRGIWIVECADLRGIRRAEVEHLKAFLSRQIDTASMKYEAETTRFHRQCIFVGTTNEKNYLMSTTGNRRFWPVPIEAFDLDQLELGRDQLWAEAAYYEAQGENIRLPPELYPAAVEAQEKREEADEWDGEIAAFLAAELADRRNIHDKRRVTVGIVADKALKIPIDRVNGSIEKRIQRAMRRAGWKFTHRHAGKRFWEPVAKAFDWRSAHIPADAQAMNVQGELLSPQAETQRSEPRDDVEGEF